MLLLGRRGNFEYLLLLLVPEPVVADGAIVAGALCWQSQLSDTLKRLFKAFTAPDAIFPL